jgi:uncharacterized protein (TIGR00730 family)
MKSVCVFCGSSTGLRDSYSNNARFLGKVLTDNNITLVYGGGNVGLMGIIADTVIEAGGKTIGVMPKSIAELEIAHNNLSELYLVDTMAERKEMMAKLSDAFIAMPGGFGTLDELSEILTYNQLRICDKPMGLLNIDGYFDGLLNFFDHAVNEKFIRDEHRKNIVVSDNATELIRKLDEYEPVQIGKWIEDIKVEAGTSLKG